MEVIMGIIRSIYRRLALKKTPQKPKCPFCGLEYRTEFRHCPRCGKLVGKEMTGHEFIISCHENEMFWMRTCIDPRVSICKKCHTRVYPNEYNYCKGCGSRITDNSSWY